MYIITVEKKEQPQQPQRPAQQSPIKRNTNFKTINEALQPDTYWVPANDIEQAQNTIDDFQDMIDFLDDMDNQFLEKDVDFICEKLYKIWEEIKELNDFVVEHVIEEE